MKKYDIKTIELIENILQWTDYVLSPDLDYDTAVEHIIKYAPLYNVNDIGVDMLRRRHIHHESYVTIAEAYNMKHHSVKSTICTAVRTLRHYPDITNYLVLGIDDISNKTQESSIPLVRLNLSTKLLNTLMSIKVVDDDGNIHFARTINDIAKLSRSDLLQVQDLGDRNVDIISDKLLEFGVVIDGDTRDETPVTVTLPKYLLDKMTSRLTGRDQNLIQVHNQ